MSIAITSESTGKSRKATASLARPFCAAASTRNSYTRPPNSSDRFAVGEVRTTAMQNLLIVNVRNEHAAQLASELDAIGLHVRRLAVSARHGCLHRNGVLQTGNYRDEGLCPLARSKNSTSDCPDSTSSSSCNITGCPNSCGQHWIADLGLEGKKIKVDGQFADAYYFCVGGAVGQFQSIARPVGYRCLATEVPDAIERLLNPFESAISGREPAAILRAPRQR